jgi:thiaminase/transcriptional activator TenA
MTEFDKSKLIQAAGDLWPAATHARFLDAVANGSLPAEAFQRWLVQDYLFAQGLVSFQALMTAKAPRDAHKLLIGGLTALDLELAWFEQHAAGLRLDVHSPAHGVCRRYVDFLIASAYTQPFAVLAAILFGVEVAYLAAWSALPPEGRYAEFITRWSNAQFGEYVRGLLGVAQRYSDASQQRAFDEVLRHERDFWQMTWEG